MTSHTQLSLANKITILRILGIPVFILLLIYYTLSVVEGEPGEVFRWSALAVFALVAATDALDGYLARRHRQISRLGRVLDPLADKALLLSGILMLTRPSVPELDPQFPIGFTLLVISRDAVLILGALVVHHVTDRLEVAPRRTGKTATFLQIVAIVFALLRTPEPWFMVSIYCAGFFTFVSGLQYLVDGLRQLEHGGENE